jgi:UDP-2,3-diacylglucosamine pyrophosphatase LpxH
VKRLIIADAHVGQREGDAADMSALVRRLPELGFGEPIYLGDAFQYLIGMSKFWTGAVGEVFASWEDLRQRGGRIVLVEGNRDFFLDDPDLASRVDWTGRCYEFQSGACRYRLIHGDRVNLRDLQYQFWSRISKSSLARLWARLLPRRVAVAIVRGMEARLATTNMRFRYRTPVAALRRTATRAWAEGVEVILFGHFHTSWEHREGDRIAMVVPDWLQTTRSMAVLANGDRRWIEKDGSMGRDTEPSSDPAGADEEGQR